MRKSIFFSFGWCCGQSDWVYRGWGHWDWGFSGLGYGYRGYVLGITLSKRDPYLKKGIPSLAITETALAVLKQCLRRRMEWSRQEIII